MAASTSTASATWPNGPSTKKKRRRSSTNLRKPRRKSRKRKSLMPQFPSDKNRPKRNPKRKSRKKRNRKKNPSRLDWMAATRRLGPFCPGVRCEDHVHHFAYWTDSHRGFCPAQHGKRAIPAFHYLRSDSRENVHARREHHRRRHTRHSRWKNRGGLARAGALPRGPRGLRPKNCGLPRGFCCRIPDSGV